MINWEEIRSDFPSIRKMYYFDTASFGLISNHVNKSSRAINDAIYKNGEQSRLTYFDKIENHRIAIKKYLKSQDGVLSFIPCFTYGLQTVVASIKDHKNILIIENDYPSLFSFWERFGHDI